MSCNIHWQIVFLGILVVTAIVVLILSSDASIAIGVLTEQTAPSFFDGAAQNGTSKDAGDPRKSQETIMHNADMTGYWDRVSIRYDHYGRVGKGGNKTPHNNPTFLVIERHKLLFCYISKVACTSFNAFFNSLQKKMKSTSPQWGKLSALRFQPKLRKSVFLSPSWRRVVFFRDPLVRFLSAYQSKCDDGNFNKDKDGQMVCKAMFPGLLQIKKALQVSFFESAIISLVSSKLERCAWNAHVAPQTCFCEGLNNLTLPAYDFVAELRTNDPADLVALVRQAVMPSEAHDSEHVTFAERMTLSFFGKPEAHSGHKTNSLARIAGRLGTLKNRSLPQLLANVYRDDYETFSRYLLDGRQFV